MRIFFVTREEPFYLPAFFERVIGQRRDDVVGMAILSPVTPHHSWFKTILEHYTLFGIWDFFRQGTLFMIYKALDRIMPRRGFSVKGVAMRFSLPIYRPQDLNSSAFLHILKEDIRPDILVSVTSPQIFRKTLLEMPPLGCINLHGALLPKYRGMMPSFWMLANGEREAGVTIHYMNRGLDDGDIIAQERFSILPEDTQDALIRRSKRIGAELLLKTLSLIEKGEIERRPNRREEATYFSFPTREDVRRFRAAGRRFR
jgi:methionyl-tRNA formyltransferase